MKKLLTMAVCLLLGVSAALAEGPLPEELLLPGQDRVTRAEAVGMACGLMEPQPGVHFSRANLVRLTDNTHAWVVTVQERGGEDQQAWTFTLSADDGELIWQEASDQGDFPQTRQAWTAALGEEGRWPDERQLLFERLYACTEDAPPAGDGAVSQEKACAIALAALGEPDASDYQAACILSGDTWQVILIQEGIAVWQVSVHAADGQVTLIAPGSPGNG